MVQECTAAGGAQEQDQCDAGQVHHEQPHYLVLVGNLNHYLKSLLKSQSGHIFKLSVSDCLALSQKYSN